MDAMKVVTVIQRSDDKHARGANTNDEATNESYEYASGEEIHVNNPYGNSSESGPKGTKDSDQQQASEADAGPATVQGVPATATAAGPAAVQQPVAAAFGGASATRLQKEPPFAPPEGDYGDETERETMTDLIYRSPSSGPGTPDFGFQEVDTDFVSKAAAHLKAQLSGDQACVRLKEELAEMEAAKATAEARAPARTP
ncbi:unnamed protein product [Cladocopium goreaui]|uniref:Uncharacterized protein n=1 Tax=Cladocopium goreaui TaxID=2562237 RepID=A0A9P1BIW0_9DINO|nr:unnamed protein product [Cladocopium goreaui]